MKRTFCFLFGFGFICMGLLTGCPGGPPLSSEKVLTAYSFLAEDNPGLPESVTGTIDGTDIAVNLPYGTDLSALIAVFTSNGFSVTVDGEEQESGVTPNDFSGPVTYIVTAEDGSTLEYTVTVTVAADSSKAITAFSFNAEGNPAISETVTGTIDGTDITLTVPHGTDVTALIAAYTATGVSVTVDGTAQESGVTANDFSSPVTYTVTARDASVQDYTVTVNIAPDTSKELTAFTFEADDNTALSETVTAEIDGTDITLVVPYGTDVSSLTASFTSTGVSVSIDGTAQESGVTQNNFTNQVTYTVTAEDGSTQDYAVTVSFGASERAGFGSESAPGDSGTLRFDSAGESLTMIYAQDRTEITFPAGLNDTADATLSTGFWIGETEVTNGAVAAVLQWAYGDERFSDTVSDPDGLDDTTVKHAGQELLNLDDPDCRVVYDGAGTFSVESGYGNHPVTNISWYGAIILCNWLTEMRDGNAENIVYTGIENPWDDYETVENPAKNGYRLPSSGEWEYAARFLGTSEPSTGGSLDTERLFGNDDPAWTDGYYWTPGNYASGAAADYNDGTASQAVAVYDYEDPDPYDDEAAVKSLGGDSSNALGLYDMAGNVWEWCFSEEAFRITISARVRKGGSYLDTSMSLQVGRGDTSHPDTQRDDLGFRLCRTADPE